jgi:hypothetical protein
MLVLACLAERPCALAVAAGALAARSFASYQRSV